MTWCPSCPFTASGLLIVQLLPSLSLTNILPSSLIFPRDTNRFHRQAVAHAEAAVREAEAEAAAAEREAERYSTFRSPRDSGAGGFTG